MFYADTSALVKLVVPEPQSPILRQWVRAEAIELASSDLARTELLRAVRRSSSVDAAAAGRARSVFDRLLFIAASPAVFEAAARLEPVELRSLDAVHIASALALGDDLEAIVTYDDRMADAARALGVRVVAPA